MAEARSADRLTSFEDRRMWRLLLARLHPDAGGDHDLFAFACAVRDEVYGGDRTVGDAGEHDGAGSAEGPVAPFLKSWQDVMSHWSSSNREALREF